MICIKENLHGPGLTCDNCGATSSGIVGVLEDRELVDKVACMANGAKFTWSERDAEEMRLTAREIIDLVRSDKRLVESEPGSAKEDKK